MFDKTCTSDAECSFGLEQTDCCGSMSAIGFASTYEDAFHSAEIKWENCSPKCNCPPAPTKVEDGSTTANPSLIGVVCQSGQCETVLAQSGVGGAGGSGGGGAGGQTICQSGFPSFDKSCATSSDCAFALHEVNCCGTEQWVSFASSETSAFGMAEQAWEACQPGCGCAQGPTTTEDGMVVTDPTKVTATCNAGTCGTTLQ